MASEATTTKAAPKPVFLLQNSKPITKVLFSNVHPDLLYSGNRNGDFNVYNLKSRRSLFQHNTESQSILSILELDSNHLLTYARNGSIYEWTSHESKYDANCVYHKEVFTFCEISHSRENKILYVPAQQASNIDCIDMDTYQKLNTLSFDSDATQLGLLMSLHAVSANHLLAGYESGHIVLFDLRKSCEVSRINVFPGQPVMCLDYSREKNLGISGSAEHFMNEFGVNEVGTLELGAKLEITNPGLNCLKIRPSDSKIFVSGGWDKRVRVFGSKKRNLLAVLDFHKEAINTIEFSSGNLMAVGANDGIISFWDLYS